MLKSGGNAEDTSTPLSLNMPIISGEWMYMVGSMSKPFGASIYGTESEVRRLLMP